ncbi:MAG TPA: metal-dependent hydrolase [Polyangiales bacterium]|nr:metal-dependent hydrolase [Polyangiales bacterium]
MAMLGHVALGLAVARAYQVRVPEAPLFQAGVLGVALAALPDLDLLGGRFGAQYGTDWGHRGFTHSLFAACVVGVLVGLWSGRFGLPRALTALFASLAMASHGLADTLTDGVNGPALLWPFSSARFLAPVHPVLPAPLGFAFFGDAGMRAVVREVVLFWPLLLYALYPRTQRSSELSTESD